ncbi:MAG: hypothetical protein V1850_00320 [Candidatus Bathyarchaeota archaeon]
MMTEKKEENQISPVMPLVSPEVAAEQWKRFEQLKEKLLSEDDYQAISGKRFIKRSGFRKIGVYFGISDRILKEDRIDRPDGSFTWRIIAEVMAPNGRTCVGVGACDSKERKFAHTEHDVFSTAHCVPVETEILTRRGFRPCDELFLGEDVLSYCVEEGICHWVPLEAMTKYASLPMVRLHNRSFEAVCNIDHSWVLSRRKCVTRLVKTNDMKYGSIVMAANTESGTFTLPPIDASTAGWILTEGTIRRPYTLQDGHSWGPYWRIHIDQSKMKYVDELKEILRDRATETVNQAPPRTFPQGHTSILQPSHRFHLNAGYAQTLIEQLGLEDPKDLSPIRSMITFLSAESRQAMLIAMLSGDGTLNRGGNWIFGVTNVQVLEIFQILATLQGQRLGKLQVENREGWKTLYRQAILTRPQVDVTSLTVDYIGNMPAWCPTTKYGTWIMRYRGCISITGNTRAKSRAISDMIAGGIVSAEEMSSEEMVVKSSPNSVENSLPNSRNIQSQSIEKVPSIEAAQKLENPVSSIEDKPSLCNVPSASALPWRAFNEKRDAFPDEDGWLYADHPDANELVDLISQHGQILVEMNERMFTCKVSGKEGQYLNRNRAKEA